MKSSLPLTWRKRLAFIPLFVPLVFMLAATAWAEGDGHGRAADVYLFLRARDWISLIFCGIGLAYLVKSRLTYGTRLRILGLVFFVFGVFSALPFGRIASAMALHPSPMCVISKPFLFLDAGYAVPGVFLTLLVFMGVVTVIGNKLFCGWSCPIGAIQEIVHRIPLPKRLKTKLPFKTTNTVRTLFFALFLVIAFSLSVDMYDYVNPFEALHWDFEIWMMGVLGIVLAASLFMYRPFCYFLCPVGLLTWGLEHISIFRVKVDRDACDDCHLCVKQSPCPTVPAILEGRRSRPDCHACGICMAACPRDALKFRV
jgi:polyferredoxin